MSQKRKGPDSENWPSHKGQEFNSVPNNNALEDRQCIMENSGAINSEVSSFVSEVTPDTQVSPGITSVGNSSSVDTEVGVLFMKNIEASANSNILFVANNEIVFQRENLAPSFIDNSRSVDTVKNNMALNDFYVHKGACRDLPNKTNLSTQTSSNSIPLEATSSINNDKSEETERISGCVSNIQQTCSNAACTLQPVATSVDAYDSRHTFISAGSNSRTTDLKCSINEAVSKNAVLQQTGSLLDDLGEAQQFDALTVEESSNLATAGPKEGASVPPSPIRGLVDELCYPNLPLKQHNKLNFCNEECANFSFRMEKKVLTDDLLMNNSKGYQAEPVACLNPALHENSALAYKSKHTDESIIQEKELTSSSYSTSSGMTNDLIVCSSLTAFPATVKPPSCQRKKLVVLDLNGLLADIKLARNRQAHKKLGLKSVFTRPFCDDFLKFCFERFHVGVWSSRVRHNVDAAVDYLMGDLKDNLLFCWDQSKCTYSGYGTLENFHKPLVLKELKKLWNKEEHDLPWEKGEFSPSNTLLVDDTPYKAICNPPHTAIFPYPYIFTKENDNSLGPGGDIRVYLEGLAMADDVQLYVQHNPFGQKAITDNDPSWSFYLRIIDKVQRYSN